jgi:hypothetical protein
MAAAASSGAGDRSDQEAYQQIEQIAAVLTHITIGTNADLRDRMPTPFDAASRPGSRYVTTPTTGDRFDGDQARWSGDHEQAARYPGAPGAAPGGPLRASRGSSVLDTR